jgi:hypothetical protein
MVSTQDEDIVDPHRGSTEGVHLKRNTVPVSTGHLDYRVQSLLLLKHTSCPGRHPDYSRLSIGHVERIGVSLQQFRFVPDYLGIS